MTIAVITRNINSAILWLTQTYEIKQVNLDRSMCIGKHDTKYILVSNYTQAVGLEFDSYLIAPDYYSLEDYVKTRLKNRRGK